MLGRSVTILATSIRILKRLRLEGALYGSVRRNYETARTHFQLGGRHANPRPIKRVCQEGESRGFIQREQGYKEL
jgi:hypothetical protein